MKDMQAILYFVARIHALPRDKRRRWAQSSRSNFVARHARRLVLAQWLAEIPQAS